jgi:hypothetical protein
VPALAVDGGERAAVQTRGWTVLLRACGWIVAALLAALHLWMLDRHAVNFPYHDDYTQLVVVPGVFDSIAGWRDKLAYVFALSVEHRIATFRLLAIAQAKWFSGLDFRALIVFGNVLAVTAALLVLSRAKPAHRGWLLAVLGAFLFSPTNFVSQVWATGALAHFSVVAYAFAALFCAARRGHAWTASAVVLATVAAFTVANGIMVFPAGVAMLWLSGRRRAAALWACATVALFALYFVGYEADSGDRLATRLREPLRLPLYAIAVLGSMAERFDRAVALGALILATWCLIALRHRRIVDPLLGAWIGFLLLSAAIVAAGRAPHGADAMVNSRYRIYSELAVAITLILLARLLPARAAKWLPALAVPAALAWFASTWPANVPHVVDVFLHATTARDRYALDGRGIYFNFPGATYGDWALALARERGYFNPAREARPAQPLQRIESADAPRSDAWAWRLDPHVDARSITVGGFVSRVASDVALTLDGAEGRYAAPLASMRMFSNVAARDRTVFWGTSLVSGVAAGRYRVGYRLGAEAAAPIVWTDDWVDIR